MTHANDDDMDGDGDGDDDDDGDEDDEKDDEQGDVTYLPVVILYLFVLQFETLETETPDDLEE